MDELDIVHDHLMDAYQYIRINRPLHARLHLGFAAAQIAPYPQELEAIREFYNLIHDIRMILRTSWPHERDLCLDALSLQIHEISDWRNANVAA